MITNTGSTSFAPVGYDAANSLFISASTQYPISNGYHSSGGLNSPARLLCMTGTNAVSYISYTVPSLITRIPEDATITAVYGFVTARVSNVSYATAATVQLYSGNIAKGSGVSVLSTSTTSKELTSATTGTWTREELNDFEIRLTVNRGTSNTGNTLTMDFYGATITVEYSYDRYEITATTNETDLEVSTNGSDLITPGGSGGTLITGNLNNIQVLDNNVDVTSILSYGDYGAEYGYPKVDDFYYYVVSGVQEDHAVVVSHTPGSVTYRVTTSSYDTGLTIDTTADRYSGVVGAGRGCFMFIYGDDYTDLFVTDNGNDITSLLEYDSTYNEYTYFIENISADHTISVRRGAEKTHVKVSGAWEEVAAYYRKTGNTWSVITKSDFDTIVATGMFMNGGVVGGVQELAIGGLDNISGVSCSFTAIANRITNVTSAATWSIVSGSQYATISVHTGEVTILNGANASQVTIQARYNGVTETKAVVLTYKAGTTAYTETETVTDESGNTTTTTTTVTENQDGSSTSNSSTVMVDGSGNTTGTQTSEQTTNTDGSYTGTSTTYDENGDATQTTNASGDTDGNISTQGIEYDESGTPIVTAYTIDTSNNPSGEKSYSGNGVNTEYYAFDMTHGFVAHIHFYINFNQQPAGQDENHHNILTMKRASPQPWYGFQLRQTGTNKYIILGTQFSAGTNTNTNISGATTASANTYEYDITITYNPTASTNKFVARNNMTNKNITTKNDVFPDVDELKYLKVTVGCALDPSGNPYRYSKIDVLDFSIIRI